MLNMTSIVKIAFAYRISRDEIVHITDVHGTSPDVVCLCCGVELTAKQGSEIQWHFAHPSGTKNSEINKCSESIAKHVGKLAMQRSSSFRVGGDFLYFLKNNQNSDAFLMKRSPSLEIIMIEQIDSPGVIKCKTGDQIIAQCKINGVEDIVNFVITKSKKIDSVILDKFEVDDATCIEINLSFAKPQMNINDISKMIENGSSLKIKTTSANFRKGIALSFGAHYEVLGYSSFRTSYKVNLIRSLVKSLDDEWFSSCQMLRDIDSKLNTCIIDEFINFARPSVECIYRPKADVDSIYIRINDNTQARSYLENCKRYSTSCSCPQCSLTLRGALSCGRVINHQDLAKDISKGYYYPLRSPLIKRVYSNMLEIEKQRLANCDAMKSLKGSDYEHVMFVFKNMDGILPDNACEKLISIPSRIKITKSNLHFKNLLNDLKNDLDSVKLTEKNLYSELQISIKNIKEITGESLDVVDQMFLKRAFDGFLALIYGYRKDLVESINTISLIVETRSFYRVVVDDANLHQECKTTNEISDHQDCKTSSSSKQNLAPQNGEQTGNSNSKKVYESCITVSDPKKMMDLNFIIDLQNKR